MRYLKMFLAIAASLLGAVLPWRTRIVFSEALGWIANLVPPDLYRMDGPADSVPRRMAPTSSLPGVSPPV